MKTLLREGVLGRKRPFAVVFYGSFGRCLFPKFFQGSAHFFLLSNQVKYESFHLLP